MSVRRAIVVAAIAVLAGAAGLGLAIANAVGGSSVPVIRPGQYCPASTCIIRGTPIEVPRNYCPPKSCHLG